MRTSVAFLFLMFSAFHSNGIYAAELDDMRIHLDSELDDMRIRLDYLDSELGDLDSELDHMRIRLNYLD